MDKIIGLGNALVDVLATLDSDEILTKMDLPKGSMTLIDEDKLLKINEEFSRMKTHLATGGSAGNAIRGMAQLGAGTGFIGKINNDSYGNFFRESLLKHGTEEVRVEAVPVAKVVDTTGAGDFFAAGFLYGLTCGYSLEKCGKIGAILSGEVIQVIGTELPDSKWEKIKEDIIMIN